MDVSEEGGALGVSFYRIQVANAFNMRDRTFRRAKEKRNMSLRSMTRRTSNRVAVLSIACLAMTVLISGCATMGGGASNPLVGTWDLVVESQLGTNEQTLVVASDLTGSITSADLGDTEISNAAVDGNSVTFDVVFDIQGQELPAKFEGTIDGDSISGEYVTELGNGTVKGTRQ